MDTLNIYKYMSRLKNKIVDNNIKFLHFTIYKTHISNNYVINFNS